LEELGTDEKIILEWISRKEPGYLSGIGLGYVLDDWGFKSQQGLEVFSSPPCPDQLCGPPSLLPKGYQGLYPVGKVARA
jgi:hypothetical protein